MNKDSGKAWLLKTALKYLGKPYIWGGDDPEGFDCSGFVNECLKTVGFIGEREDYSAEGLWELYAKNLIDKPRAGALLFYFSPTGKCYHVAICLDEYYQIGSSGGHKDTIDLAVAWKHNAYVKIRPINYNSNTMKVVYLF